MTESTILSFTPAGADVEKQCKNGCTELPVNMSCASQNMFDLSKISKKGIKQNRGRAKYSKQTDKRNASFA